MMIGRFSKANSSANRSASDLYSYQFALQKRGQCQFEN